MIPRFFAPDADVSGSTIALPEDEAKHLARVLRLTRGAAIRVFDGRGREWHATVSEIARHRVAVQVGEPVGPRPESQVAIALAVAMLKGDKMDEAIRDAVMLGAAAIQPIISSRTEVGGRRLAGGRTTRWQRIAIASAKQCGRAVVAKVHDPLTFTEAIASPASGLRLMLAEPGARLAGVRRLQELPRSHTVEVFVGPEGGWTDEELRHAVDHGAVVATLGNLTLRADAAPLVALTALRAIWDDL